MDLNLFVFLDPSEIVKEDRARWGYGENIGLWGIAPTTISLWLKKVEDQSWVSPQPDEDRDLLDEEDE